MLSDTGWVQGRVVLQLQALYRCDFFIGSRMLISRQNYNLCCVMSRSHLARRLLAHITLQTQGVARTRLRASRDSGSRNNRAHVEGIKVLHAYGGRKSVLYTLLNSATDTTTSTGSPSAASRHNRDERLKQLVAFAGKSNRLLVKPFTLCLYSTLNVSQATYGWTAALRAGCGALRPSLTVLL